MSVRSFTDKQGRLRFAVDCYPDGANGKRFQKWLSVGYDLETAKEFEALIMDRADSSPAPEDAHMTVNQVFPKYLSWYETNGTESTYKDLSLVWRCHFQPHLGEYRIDRLGVQQIELYKRIRKQTGRGRCHDTPLSNRTINRELSYLSGFLSWLEENGVIPQRQRTWSKSPSSIWSGTKPGALKPSSLRPSTGI